MKRFISILLAVTFIFAFAVSASARLVGDVDSNGKVNSTDALLVLRRSVDSSVKVNETYADVNSDGKINSTDALIILKISVGSYNGKLEVEDDLKTSYLADKVTPIMETGKFTLVTEIVSGETTATATIMVKGNDLCIDTTAEGVTVRLLLLENKKYFVLPVKVPLLGNTGVYDEYDADISFDMSDSLTAKYIKSEYVTVDGKEYICETYKISNGNMSQYYFTEDGKWVMYGTVKNGETQTQKIVSLKKGVDENCFSLKGMTKTDLSDLMPQ